MKKKILMCTGEENTFDNEMTMFSTLNDNFEVFHCKMFANDSKIHKLLRNLGPFFVKHELDTFLKDDLSEYDTIILFECVVKNFFIRYIRKKNPNIRIIIYFRNQFSFSKKRNVSLSFLKKLGCEFWSYHLNDCEKFEFNYNNQFWNTSFQKKVSLSKQEDVGCLFMGRIKNRLEDILKIYEILEKYKLKNYIYLVPRTNYDFDKNINDKYMEYIYYLKKLSKSKCVIDLVNSENFGLTLRPLEAMFYKKKLITNYVDIVKYDFYNPNNIFVLGIDKIDEIPIFLENDYEEISEEIVNRYNFDNWLDNFFK